MKKFLLLLLSLLLVLPGCSKAALRETPSSEKPSADTILRENASWANQSMDTMYHEFLSNEETAIDKNGNTITIAQYRGNHPENNQYAIYDMNGDDIPELLIKTATTLDIFWIKDAKVTLWHQSSNYTEPLNTMALLEEKKGAAPEHTDYRYSVLSYQGEEIFAIAFSEYSATEFQGTYFSEKYFINNTEVTQEVYQSLAEPLLAIGTDKIQWKAF